jgi:hypothetical protein
VLSCSEAGRKSKLTKPVVEGVVSKQGTSGIVEKGRIPIRKSVISKLD